jgi:hypothetical protein
MMAYRVRQVVGEQVWGTYFKFAFVRNPFARAVSYYTWVAKEVRAASSTAWLPAPLRENRAIFTFPVTQAYLETESFSEFIRHPGFLNDHGCRPQMEFITHPKTGTVEVDFIGKVETLADDLRTIGERLTGKLLVPREANVSRKRTNTAEFFTNDEDISYIRELYARDFEQLGYAHA